MLLTRVYKQAHSEAEQAEECNDARESPPGSSSLVLNSHSEGTTMQILRYIYYFSLVVFDFFVEHKAGNKKSQ